MCKLRRFIVLLALGFAALPIHAQTMQLVTSSDDYVVTNVFSDVDDFDFVIEIDAPLAVGVYANPPIVSVSYRVSGNLNPGTPSDFPGFALERVITGEEFYAQGSSLQFEIDEAAVLDDGVQIAELSGTDLIFSFDGKEIGNERFHPALFELRSDGTGQIQNSNNIPTLSPLLQVDFGEEYISGLIFDAGNITLITALEAESSSDSGGFFSHLELLVLLGFGSVMTFRKNALDVDTYSKTLGVDAYRRHLAWMPRTRL